MSDIKLKPCPFCGGEAEARINTEKSYISLRISCGKCGLKMPGEGIVLKNGSDFNDIVPFMQKAVEIWNRRVADE